MFFEVLRHIWNNRISRMIMILFFLLIMVSVILRANIGIYNFFYNLTAGQLFLDPSTYHNHEYGFSENPQKAEKLFRKGLKKLVKLAANTYNDPAPSEYFNSGFSHDTSWENFTDDKAIELVHTLLSDVGLFCMPYDEASASVIQETLEKRHYVIRKSSTDPLNFGVKDDEFVSFANTLLELDRDYFFIALQKKPDSIPLLSLRSLLLKAVCQPRNIALQLTRAVQYQEYSTEKKLYQEEKIQNPNELYHATMERLRKSKKYSRLLREQFLQTHYSTANVVEKIKQSYNYYILQPNDLYFESYLKSVMELSSISGIEQNKQIIQTLRQAITEKNESNPELLYALAEVSFRARYIDESEKYLLKILETSKPEGADFYRINRLLFLIDLMKAG